ESSSAVGRRQTALDALASNRRTPDIPGHFRSFSNRRSSPLDPVTPSTVYSRPRRQPLPRITPLDSDHEDAPRRNIPADDGPGDDGPGDEEPGDDGLGDDNPDEGPGDEPEDEGNPFKDDKEEPDMGIITFNNLAQAIDNLARVSCQETGSELSGHTKLREPDTFDGTDAKKLRAFLIQCELNFQDQPRAFRLDWSKVTFAQ